MGVYQDALELWGEEAQLDVAIEECSELIKAICKRKRGDAFAEDKVLEEVADVAIMLEQLVWLFGQDKYDEVFKDKLERLKLHIENSKVRKPKGGTNHGQRC